MKGFLALVAGREVSFRLPDNAIIQLCEIFINICLAVRLSGSLAATTKQKLPRFRNVLPAEICGTVDVA